MALSKGICMLNILRVSLKKTCAQGPWAVYNLGFTSSTTGDKENETDKNEKSELSLHFMPNSVTGVMIDPKEALKSSCIKTLQSLFENSPNLCFINYQSVKGNHDFSNVSKSIFAKVLTVSYQQFETNGHRFKFDPNAILVKFMDHMVLDVAIPRNQIADPTAKSVYTDGVVGPFAAMVWSLCMALSNDDPTAGGKTADYCYKEIYDLLFRAKSSRWWKSLAELLKHPLFWTIEDKTSTLIFFNMCISPAKSGLDHLIPNISICARPRSMYPLAFIMKLMGQIYFRKEYTFTVSDEEIIVEEHTNNNSWEDFMLKAKCFGTGYVFGRGRTEYVFGGKKVDFAHRNMINQCCIMVVHFPDSNMNAFAMTLDKPTIKVAMIFLDKSFGPSLSIYHTLRILGIADVLSLQMW